MHCLSCECSSNEPVCVFCGRPQQPGGLPSRLTTIPAVTEWMTLAEKRARGMVA